MMELPPEMMIFVIASIKAWFAWSWYDRSCRRMCCRSPLRRVPRRVSAEQVDVHFMPPL